MANKDITTLSRSDWHTDGNINTHKGVTSRKWIGSGSASSGCFELINQTLIPTMGTATSDRPFEAKNTGLFEITTTPYDLYDIFERNGFEFKKTSTTNECAVNLAVKHSGDNGMVITASLIRSVGIEFKRNTTANSNWRVWNIGLEFKHYADTSGMFAELYTPGWTNAKTDASGYTHYTFNGSSHFNQIRNLGPDYGLSRVIFNLRSNSSSGAQSPSAKLFHIKIGYDSGLSSDDYRIIKPANQTWDEWVADRRAGHRSFN